MAKDKKLGGVGGWLLMFTIYLFFICLMSLFNFIYGLRFFSEGFDKSNLVVFIPGLIAIPIIYSLFLEFKNKKEFLADSQIQLLKRGF